MIATGQNQLTARLRSQKCRKKCVNERSTMCSAEAMRRAVTLGFFAAITEAFLAGCDGLSLDTYWRSERYVLLAVDARSQMNLAFDLRDGTALGLVGPTVFSFGADDKYIVLKQHPASDQGGMSFDRSVTNYFIVGRTQSPEFRERKEGVRGPMKKEEFEKLAASLSLPPFTKTFHDLE